MLVKKIVKILCCCCFLSDYFDDGFDNFSGGFPPDCGMGGFGGFSGGMGPRGNSFGMGMGMGRGVRGKRPFIGGYRGNPTQFESQTGHSVHMRGLPYCATDHDIHQVHCTFYKCN